MRLLLIQGDAIAVYEGRRQLAVFDVDWQVADRAQLEQLREAGL